MPLRTILATVIALLALPAPADEMRTLSGQIMLFERIALPDDTVILVDISTLNDRPLVHRRAATDGQQSPFDIRIDAPVDQDLVLRLGLRAADELLWLSEPRLVPAGSDPVDFGTIRALRAPQMGFARLYACGNTLLELGLLPDMALVRLNEQVLSLQAQPAASGQVFVDPANPATSLQIQVGTALLRVDGAELSECQHLHPETDFTEALWNISALEDKPTLFPSRTELVFFPDGRISATVGCNRFIGSYRRHGGILSFGAIASTRMGCPEGLATQEAQFVDVLQQIDGYRLDPEAERLTLSAQDQPLLQARK